MTAGSSAYTAEVWPSPPCSVTSTAAAMPCSTLGERTRPSTGISFSCTSGCAPSCSRSAGSGASSSFVSGGTVSPARAASCGASWPSAPMFTLSPIPVAQPNANWTRLSASSAVSRWAPIRWNSVSISS